LSPQALFQWALNEPTAATLERHTKPLFDLEDVPAERGLLDVQIAGCPAETSSFGGSQQVRQLAKFNHIWRLVLMLPGRSVTVGFWPWASDDICRAASEACRYQEALPGIWMSRHHEQDKAQSHLGAGGALCVRWDRTFVPRFSQGRPEAGVI
jgi:hypothetical protein